jgi:two-component sensor histidine kinase/CheY-like chemotaxis protein
LTTQTKGGPAPQRQVILLVDDDARNLAILSDYLSGFALTILVAEDGESGIERARYAVPDLILLDVLLPGMDGYAICRRLKADPGTADIPVIFMTALDETEFIIKGFEAGGVDYVTKPFQREEVLARVSVHLRIAELARGLREANDLLERRVAERTSDLAAANRTLEADVAERKMAEDRLKSLLVEKSELLKEIHHRVKNNLQVINSILNLGAVHVSDPAAAEILRRIQGRIGSMALVHECLYRSPDLASIDVRSYVEDLLDEIVSEEAGASGVAFSNEIKGLRLPIESAVPCGLAIYELVTNAFAHAFPEHWTGERRITMSMERGKTICALLVSDTGIGLPAGFDPATVPTLGLRLACAAVGQLHGVISIGAGPGAKLRIEFPESFAVDGPAIEMTAADGKVR